MALGDPKRGDLFLVKADSTGAGVFVTIAALRASSLVINGQAIDITNKDSAKRRALLPGGGIVSFQISGSGVFTEHAEQDRLEDRLLSGALFEYQVVMEGGRVYEGLFQVTQMQYEGPHDGEETFSFTLESSGAVTVQAGA